MNDFYNEFLNTKAWPFEEARKLLERVSKTPDKEVILETGYGPSGLPHIGTFGEVTRTSMVLNAFKRISDRKAKIICFSDDMDGLRKVPSNVPNQDMLKKYIDFPLTKVPDPFGKYNSFGEHNNAMLIDFLDRFGFEYEFKSATDCYKAGLFDEMLLRVLKYHKEILDIMLLSLGEERRATYSPFLPISPTSGKVLQVAIEEYKENTIVFRDENGELCEVLVTGGACKLQWKVDWAMRWVGLGVDYEIFGKDLIDTATLSFKICKVLGGLPPDGFSYEHFLDEHGAKISKSKGNGISIEEWLNVATNESLAHFMYNNPKRAKRLYFDVIPKSVDEYLISLNKFNDQDNNNKLLNSVWHIHNGNPPNINSDINFGILLNITSVGNCEDKETLWKYLHKYYSNINEDDMKLLDSLMEYAIKYYNIHVKSKKTYRLPSDLEKKALLDLKETLSKIDDSVDEKGLQNILFEIAKKYEFNSIKDWFECLYEVLLGQKDGPRMGSFIKIYGISDTIKLIEKVV